MKDNSHLLTPQWKQRRGEILNRDNFACTKCGSDKTLQVHHIKYSKALEYWQYPDELLITLCKSCHEKEHEGKDIGTFYTNEVIKPYKLKPVKIIKIKPRSLISYTRELNQLNRCAKGHENIAKNYRDKAFELCKEKKGAGFFISRVTRQSRQDYKWFN